MIFKHNSLNYIVLNDMHKLIEYNHESNTITLSSNKIFNYFNSEEICLAKRDILFAHHDDIVLKFIHTFLDKHTLLFNNDMGIVKSLNIPLDIKNVNDVDFFIQNIVFDNIASDESIPYTIRLLSNYHFTLNNHIRFKNVEHLSTENEYLKSKYPEYNDINQIEHYLEQRLSTLFLMYMIELRKLL